MVEGGGMIRQVEETENKQKTKDTDRKWRRTKSDHTRGTDSTERQTRPNICIELLRHLTYRSLTKAPNMCSVTSANRKAMFNIFGLIVGHSFHLVRRRGKKWSNKHHAGVCLQLRYWWCVCVCVTRAAIHHHWLRPRLTLSLNPWNPLSQHSPSNSPNLKNLFTFPSTEVSALVQRKSFNFESNVERDKTLDSTKYW